MRLFKYRSFAASSGLTLLAALTMGAGIVQPLFLQQVHGESPMSTGLLLMGFGVGSALTSVLLSRVFNRLGSRMVGLLGLAFAVVGTVAFTRFDAGTGRAAIVLAMLLSGVGLAMVTLTMSTAPAQAYHHSFGWSAGFLMLAVVPALLLPGRTVSAQQPDQGRQVPQSQGAQSES